MFENKGHRYEKGHPKWGGRQKGVRDKKIVAREQLAAHALRAVGLTPEEVEALSPLAAMRLILAARMKSGDLVGALAAAEAAAPYCHARLQSTDLRVSGQLDNLSDEELRSEIALLESQAAEVKKLN